MSIQPLTAAQHSIMLPESIREKALRWVQTQAAASHRKPTDAPFRRLIDFWFASIAWAVHKNVKPVKECSGTKFVSIGPKSNDVTLEDWRCDLLTILAVCEFGHDDEQVQDLRSVVDLANRYAEAGAPGLVEALEGMEEFAVPMLYRVIDLFLQETATIAQQEELTF